MADELTPDDVLHDLQHLLAYGWGRLEVVIQRGVIEAIEVSAMKKRRAEAERLEKMLQNVLTKAKPVA